MIQARCTCRIILTFESSKLLDHCRSCLLADFFNRIGWKTVAGYLVFDSTAARSIRPQYARSKEWGIQITLYRQNIEFRPATVSQIRAAMNITAMTVEAQKRIVPA